MTWSLETVRIGGFDTVTADRTELASWMAAVCAEVRAGESAQ